MLSIEVTPAEFETQCEKVNAWKADVGALLLEARVMVRTHGARDEEEAKGKAAAKRPKRGEGATRKRKKPKEADASSDSD